MLRIIAWRNKTGNYAVAPVIAFRKHRCTDGQDPEERNDDQTKQNDQPGSASKHSVKMLSHAAGQCNSQLLVPHFNNCGRLGAKADRSVLQVRRLDGLAAASSSLRRRIRPRFAFPMLRTNAVKAAAKRPRQISFPRRPGISRSWCFARRRNAT